MNSISPPAVLTFLIIISRYHIAPATAEIGVNSSELPLSDKQTKRAQTEDKNEEIPTNKTNRVTSILTDTESTASETTSASSEEFEQITEIEPQKAEILVDSTSKYSASIEVAEKNEPPGKFSKLLSKLGLTTTKSQEEKEAAYRRVRREEREAEKKTEREKRLKYLSKGMTDVCVDDIISENKFELCSELNENPKKDLMEEGEAPTCKQFCLYRKMKLPNFIKGQNGACKRELMKSQISNKVAILMESDLVCYCEVSKKGDAKFIQIKDTIYNVFNNIQSIRSVTIHHFLATLKHDLDSYKHKYFEHRQKKWNKKHRIRNIFRKETEDKWFQLVTAYVSEKVDDAGKMILI